MKTLTRWTQEERAKVVCRAAILMMEHGYTAYGPTAVEAQKVLPPSRRRSESSLIQNAKSSLGEEIVAEINAVTLAKLNANTKKTTSEPQPEVIAQAEEPIQILHKKGFEKAESLVSLAVESFTDEFRTLLRAALMSTVVEVIEESNEAMRKALEKLPKGPVEIHAEIGKTQEVQAQSTKGQELKAHMIKVAVLGGTECGKDGPRIEHGLKEVYDFKFIESKNQANRAVNCDMIVVRKAFVSHALCETVERLVGKDKMHYVTSRSPERVNEYLLDHYTRSAS